MKDTDVDAVGRRKPGCELLLWVTPFFPGRGCGEVSESRIGGGVGPGSRTLISAKHDKAHSIGHDLSKYSRNRNLRKIMSEL